MSDEDSAPIVEALSKNPKKWVDFMMRFELGLEKPDPKRAFASALTIGGVYAVGGLIPLSPYVVASVFGNITVTTALLFSVALTLVALFVFGFVKGRFTGTRPMRSALQTALIGSVAARLFDCAGFLIGSMGLCDGLHIGHASWGCPSINCNCINSYELHVGTSGYSYKEWKGNFYPEDLPAKEMLSYYSRRLPAVEINNTFYRLPQTEHD